MSVNACCWKSYNRWCRDQLWHLEPTNIQHLTQEPFLVGGRYSIADIGLYAYTGVAHDVGFDLQRFPAVRAWLARVEAQPGYVRMRDD